MANGSSEQFLQWTQGHGWNNDALLRSAMEAGFLDTNNIVFDAIGGGVSVGIGYGMNQKLFKPILDSFGDQVITTRGIGMLQFLPNKGGGLNGQIIYEGRTIILSASNLENILKAIAAGSYDIASEILQELINTQIQELGE